MRRRPFRKEYLGEWSEEIFEIASQLPTVPVTYEKVTKSDYERFEIDRILKTRKRNGKIQYFVACKGYPNKFNSWVDELVSK